jgi:cytosine/adenosine deaminase-related metal-dependent hydrolase
MHVEEQLPEVEQSLAVFGKTPLRVLLDMGVPLDHVTLVHCIHSTDADMDEFIAKGTQSLHLLLTHLQAAQCACVR